MNESFACLGEWEIDAFAQTNTIYYKDMCRANAARTRYKGWNWCGLFFSMEWLVYRKMYIEALACFLLTSAIPVASSFLNTSHIAQVIMFCCIRLYFGAFGNAIYIRKAIRAANESSGAEESARLAYIKESGGVTRAGLIACILLHLALIVADAL